ncbi:hypothetical protein BGZ73_000376 [Actinomortierella ambigua]|nr:hypothetical protein BGZ73_000376 [Actinomortierella ambigua]
MQPKWPFNSGTALALATFVFTNTVGALPAGILSCLQGTISHTNSSLTTPTSSAYDIQRLVYDRNFDYKPTAIYYPANIDDAAAAIRCAAELSIPVAPRSGGHSFEAYSVGGWDGSLVVDLANFQHFFIDHATGIATIGAGTRLGSLYARLWGAGEYYTSSGICPTVGIGGIALGGGIGMASRKYGMTTHNVVGMKMIDAKGNILQVDAETNSDLFWALRGAGGGSFGLVTEFQIRAYKAPPIVTTFVLTYPGSKYREAIQAYGTWGSQALDDFYMGMIVMPESILLFASFLGPKEQIQDHFSSFLQMLGEPTAKTVDEGSWYKAATLAARSLAPENPDMPGYRYHRGRSLVYRKPLSDTELDVIHKYMHVLPKPQSANDTHMIFELWGGKIDRPDHPSVFDHHRGVLYSIQSSILWNVPSGRPGVNCAECLEWSSAFAREMQVAYSSGPKLEAYQNYMERDLPDALHAYYGDHLQRLMAIKQRVDPDDVFKFPQSIPLPYTGLNT